jgi:hypothetical protein
MTAGVVNEIEIVKQPLGFLRNPTYVEAVVLVANTAQQVTVPVVVDAAAFILFTGNCDYYVAYGANPTAAVPSASTTDGSSNELNPTQRFLGTSVAKLSLISPQGGVVTLAFYKS